MRILILCTGNSCRSQMAHGFLQSLDPSLEVFSGGTHPAARVNAKAAEAMREVGIDIGSHVPTHVNCLFSTYFFGCSIALKTRDISYTVKKLSERNNLSLVI